jgi:subtilisin family serine protease
MVIVNSAGNSGLKYPENPAPMAYATRPDGSLYLNGQMLVVGAYDINTNTIASYSNQAGHICQGFNIVNGTCQDKYRMSDFYILAPGNMFSPGKTGDTYVIGTGTSEAAAVVSGAVAVIHQQWPLMTGSNIVKLLTATANKNLANYDQNVMGAGLLDLEKATRPYGVVGIPTDGRYGVKTALSGGFSTSTSGGLATLSSLSNVMVTDDFGIVMAKMLPRDYKKYQDFINTYGLDEKALWKFKNEMNIEYLPHLKLEEKKVWKYKTQYKK